MTFKDTNPAATYFKTLITFVKGHPVESDGKLAVDFAVELALDRCRLP